MEWFKDWWPLLVFVFNAIGGLLIWALHRTYASKDQVNQIDKRVEVIENTIDIAGLKEVAKELHGIRAEVDGMQKLMARMSNQLDMLVENELNQSRSKQ